MAGKPSQPIGFLLPTTLSCPHESVTVPHCHAQRSARRCRSRQSPTDDARRPDQETRRRHLQLHAHGPARDPQGRGHHPRGDGARWRGRAAHAGGAASRAMAGDRALREDGPRVAAREGPPRARLRDPAHERRGRHRHRAPGTAQLQAITEEFLSHPDQVSRRAPPALRRDARARVHDEGRLLLRP